MATLKMFLNKFQKQWFCYKNSHFNCTKLKINQRRGVGMDVGHDKNFYNFFNFLKKIAWMYKKINVECMFDANEMKSL